MILEVVDNLKMQKCHFVLVLETGSLYVSLAILEPTM